MDINRAYMTLPWVKFRFYNIDDVIITVKPFPKQQVLDSSNIKVFADDNFNVVENGKKLSKQVENIVGKGEIACYEQFLLFPKCFRNTCPTNT